MQNCRSDVAYNTRDDKGRYKIAAEVVEMYEKTEKIDEKNMEIEIRYCRFFGCAKRLSLIESLCGDFCEKHMNYEKPRYYNGLL